MQRAEPLSHLTRRRLRHVVRCGAIIGTRKQHVFAMAIRILQRQKTLILELSVRKENFWFSSKMREHSVLKSYFLLAWLSTHPLRHLSSSRTSPCSSVRRRSLGRRRSRCRRCGAARSAALRPCNCRPPPSPWPCTLTTTSTISTRTIPCFITTRTTISISTHPVSHPASLPPLHCPCGCARRRRSRTRGTGAGWRALHWTTRTMIDRMRSRWQ